MYFIKWLLFSLLLISANICFAQGKNINYNQIDWNVLSVEAATPELLAQKLTHPYSSELEKVRSIFRWITEHIDYNTIIYNRYNRVYRKSAIDEDDDTSSVLKPLNERVATNVIKRKLAVCDGYARLFKTLCDYAGIKSEVVTGYARTGANNGSFRSNHSWNAVMIDSNWYLLDATWASGYISYWGNEYVKKYNDYYFLTPPKEFIQDHYPEDLKWTLLKDPPTLREYNHSPFKHSSFVKYKINTFKPSSGVIEVAVGDTIQLEILVREVEPLTGNSTNFTIDSTLAISTQIAYLKPFFTGKQKIIYQYIVQPQVNWLHLVYDEDILLRYRVKIKEPIAVNQ